MTCIVDNMLMTCDIYYSATTLHSAFTIARLRLAPSLRYARITLWSWTIDNLLFLVYQCVVFVSPRWRATRSGMA